MKKCENGHFYDETRFDACPYCSDKNSGANKTMAINTGGKTVPLNDAVPQNPADRGKTVGLIKKKVGIDPAVGFIVCIEGENKGEHFAIKAGRSFIGRSSGMDVALTSDETVSRENHALISYDVQNNQFMIVPGQGRGLTYLNGKTIEFPAPLQDHDIIGVGESTLIFVPLCNEKFSWEKK